MDQVTPRAVYSCPTSMPVSPTKGCGYPGHGLSCTGCSPRQSFYEAQFPNMFRNSYFPGINIYDSVVLIFLFCILTFFSHLSYIFSLSVDNLLSLSIWFFKQMSIMKKHARFYSINLVCFSIFFHLTRHLMFTLHYARLFSYFQNDLFVVDLTF